MVEGIRNIEEALGDGVKRPMPSELGNRDVSRKSIVASQDINPGQKFTEENLITKRPGSGISPMKWDQLLLKSAHRKFFADELIDEA
jgi:N,N'-diacetyllegionaminate synthase